MKNFSLMRKKVAKKFQKIFEEVSTPGSQTQTENNTNKSGTIYALNSPILTSFGTYEYKQITEEEASEKLKSASKIVSAVGHQAAADAFTAATGVQIPMNRVEVKMNAGDEAIVMKVNGRLPEGKVLSLEELKSIGFTLGLLKKTGE